MVNRIRSKSKLIFWDFFINTIASSKLTIPLIRKKIYNVFGISTNTKKISHDLYFRSSNVEIGEGSWINSSCFFDNTHSAVKIGKNCGIAMGVMFCTNTHLIGKESLRAGKSTHSSIEVGDGSWIGTRATILPGVKIGRGCIIAAGAVVNKDCEPNGLYAGVPAKRVKDLAIDEK